MRREMGTRTTCSLIFHGGCCFKTALFFFLKRGLFNETHVGIVAKEQKCLWRSSFKRDYAACSCLYARIDVCKHAHREAEALGCFKCIESADISICIRCNL